jgi:hypothetical protein
VDLEAGGLAAGVATVAAAAGCTVQPSGGRRGPRRRGDPPRGRPGRRRPRGDPARSSASRRRALDPTDGDGDDAGAEDLAVPVEALIVGETRDAPPSLDEDRRATGSSLGPVGSATLDHDDLELALRYLDSFSVVVVAEPLDPAAQAVVAEAAATPRPIELVAPDGQGPAAAIVLEAPATDGLFARTTGSSRRPSTAGPIRRRHSSSWRPGLAASDD